MKITNTQYLKVGDKTNVGEVWKIHDNKNFMAMDGFSYNLDEVEIFKLNK